MQILHIDTFLQKGVDNVKESVTLEARLGETAKHTVNERQTMDIQFVTDRDYGAPQLISVSVEQTEPTDFDQFVDLTAVFHDTARHIKGRVYLPMMNANYTAQQLQREIMRSYDANQYTDI